MFLILLSLITLGSESQISVFKKCQSNTQISVFWGEHAQKPKLGDCHFFSEKKFVRHFTRFNFSRLSLAYLVYGEKIIRLASKNSVKLCKKTTSDF